LCSRTRRSDEHNGIYDAAQSAMLTDTSQASDFAYDALVHDVYGLLVDRIGRVQLQGGVRAEHAGATFDLRTRDQRHPGQAAGRPHERHAAHHRSVQHRARALGNARPGIHADQRPHARGSRLQLNATWMFGRPNKKNDQIELNNGRSVACAPPASSWRPL
jgi:Outer membrane protein beta-barrel family